MSEPIAQRWLPNDGLGVVFADMAPGYQLTDYPGEKSGSGRVAELYDREHEWVAQLWTDDKNGCDVILNEEQCSDLAYYTRAALFLRLFHHRGDSATKSFEFLVNDYNATARVVSDLSTVTGQKNSGVASKKSLPKKK